MQVSVTGVCRLSTCGSWLVGFPGGSDSKESACSQEGRVQSLGQEDPLKKGVGTHSIILAWRVPLTTGSWWAQSMELQRVGHD